MPDDKTPSELTRVEAEASREEAEDRRVEADHERGSAEDHRASAESARKEAERFRVLAEEARTRSGGCTPGYYRRSGCDRRRAQHEPGADAVPGRRAKDAQATEAQETRRRSVRFGRE